MSQWVKVGVRGLQWLVYLPANFLMLALAYALAPVLAGYTTAIGVSVMPAWLSLFATPDNPLDGDAGHRARWPDNSPWGAYKRRTAWLWRNPINGFTIGPLGAKGVLVPFVLGNPGITDNPYTPGWCLRLTIEGYWQIYYISPSWHGIFARLNFGWKLWGPKPSGQYVFSPVLRSQ